MQAFLSSNDLGQYYAASCCLGYDDRFVEPKRIQQLSDVDVQMWADDVGMRKGDAACLKLAVRQEAQRAQEMEPVETDQTADLMTVDPAEHVQVPL